MADRNPEQDPDYIPGEINVTVYMYEPEPQPPAYHNSRWFGPALVFGAIALSALVVTTCGAPRANEKTATVNEVTQRDIHSNQESLVINFRPKTVKS